MVTFSFNVPGAPQPITAPLAGLAVYKALRETFGEAPVSVKAPNDILLEKKKICGILVETVQMGQQHRLIIGLGLNVFSAPTGVPDAGFLADKALVNRTSWTTFLKKLTMQLQWAAQGSQTAHIGDSDRSALLQALNLNPNLAKNYVSLSPFGDLVTDTETLSWRSL
jgi:BirA family biotin operon repressor/biotin-[acetyl-CoA-carboxylase] ligase